MSYKLSKVEYTSLKRRLTVAQSQLRVATSAGDPTGIRTAAEKVIAEVDKATAVFEAKGYPDSWSNWDRAKDDAWLVLIRTKTGGGL
jgi:hypothetical protein